MSYSFGSESYYTNTVNMLMTHRVLPQVLCKTLQRCSIERHLSGSDQLYQHCVIFFREGLNVMDVQYI